ncbi:hypothetical protein Pla123a_31080 [Posidoniimonas polymericola]|uniref:Type IV / VI secretion system DotU domain-containing protein n=1 Tax=Posidoniimonas polymericola TaxID=2528002 RepID=A0A5C5YLF8_9BACT|nr:DotU family type IV/VI secretion system protein [Posidoniimonas polymericola]TWT75598.1 hypothetical protein Pla123a_31080 [Posidoniimonas polymericola]
MRPATHQRLHEPLHSAIDYALRLHTAVGRGAELCLAKEQAVLTNLALEVPDGGADPAFRGARYALVCWLDELFICHSDWADRWSERKLESTLYGGNDRAWDFWRQAKLAAAQTDDDALGAYYLCAALGFRGEMRTDPAALNSWFDQTRTRVTRHARQRTPQAAGSRRRRAGAPLRGEARLRRMLAIAAVVTIALAPLATYAVMQRLLA